MKSSTLIKKLFISFTFMLLATNITNAAVRVSPSYVEVDANKAKKDYITGSFTVSGGKDETIRFKVYPEYFEYDSKGRFVSLEDKGQARSLMGKLKFYPNEFTCKNGIMQKVRFTITDIKKMPPGESKLVLFLEDVNTKEVMIKKANGQIGGKIIVKTRVGVPVYLDKGNYSKKGVLDAVALKQNGEEIACEYKVSSLGNSKIRYSGFGYLSQGDKLIKQYDIHGSTVEGGKFLEMVQKLELPKDSLVAGQEYKFKFVLTYRDEKDNQKVLKKEMTFIPEKSSIKAI